MFLFRVITFCCNSTVKKTHIEVTVYNKYIIHLGCVYKEKKPCQQWGPQLSRILVIKKSIEKLKSLYMKINFPTQQGFHFCKARILLWWDFFFPCKHFVPLCRDVFIVKKHVQYSRNTFNKKCYKNRRQIHELLTTSKKIIRKTKNGACCNTRWK